MFHSMVLLFDVINLYYRFQGEIFKLYPHNNCGCHCN